MPLLGTLGGTGKTRPGAEGRGPEPRRLRLVAGLAQGGWGRPCPAFPLLPSPGDLLSRSPCVPPARGSGNAGLRLVVWSGRSRSRGGHLHPESPTATGLQTRPLRAHLPHQGLSPHSSAGPGKTPREIPSAGTPTGRSVSGWIRRGPGHGSFPDMGEHREGKGLGAGVPGGSLERERAPVASRSPASTAYVTQDIAASTPESALGASACSPPIPQWRVALRLPSPSGGMRPVQLPRQCGVKGSRRAELPGAHGLGIPRSLLHRAAPALPGFLYNSITREAPAESARQNFLPDWGWAAVARNNPRRPGFLSPLGRASA
nr:uncharacterized protein LOC112424513 [Macaca nemestrina]